MILPCPLSFTWKHQSTLNTELQKKVQNTHSTRKPSPRAHHQDASVAVSVDAPELQVCLGLDGGSAGRSVDQRQLPEAASFPNAGHPLPVDINLPQHKTKESKAELEFSSSLPKRLLVISFLIVNAGDTEGKQERDASDSWSPKRGTTCSVDRISSCLASEQWLYLLSGFSAPMVSWHHVFPLVFKAQAVSKQNCHNFGFLLTLSDLKGRRFVDMCNEDYWNVPWPWNEKQSKQGNIFWKGPFFFLP